MIVLLIILNIIIFIVLIFKVSIVQFIDGYYLVWYKKYNSYQGIINVKYSKRIIKFKDK